MSSSCPGTSSCGPDWPQTHGDLPASASRVLRLKVLAATGTVAWYTSKLRDKLVVSSFWGYIWKISSRSPLFILQLLLEGTCKTGLP